MNFTVRQARIDELRTIQDLNYKLFEWDYDRDPTLNMKWPYEKEGIEYFTKRISGEWGACFVVVHDERIIGYATGSIDKEISPIRTVLHGELETIFIEKEFRGQKIGRQLVDAIIRHCKNKGAQAIVVSSYYYNENAVAFYETCGFKPLEIKLAKELV